MAEIEFMPAIDAITDYEGYQMKSYHAKRRAGYNTVAFSFDLYQYTNGNKKSYTQKTPGVCLILISSNNAHDGAIAVYDTAANTKYYGLSTSDVEAVFAGQTVRVKVKNGDLSDVDIFMFALPNISGYISKTYDAIDYTYYTNNKQEVIHTYEVNNITYSNS